jgi:tRNA threonylcarbamoyl adenosine modification protein YeaZ
MEEGVVAAETIVEPSAVNRQELATNLLPAIKGLFKHVGWDKTSIGAAVVGRGPGSFTSIRAAVVVARTLAYALKLPLIGLSRFEVIASCFEGPVGVVLPAYRDSCYACVLELKDNGQTQLIIEPGSVELPELDAFFNQARETFGVSNFCIDSSISIPSKLSFKPLPEINNPTVKQAEIAWNRLSLKTNNPDDVVADDFPWQLVEPLYLREPSVSLKKS